MSVRGFRFAGMAAAGVEEEDIGEELGQQEQRTAALKRYQ
jgi:hypothetical protein